MRKSTTSVYFTLSPASRTRLRRANLMSFTLLVLCLLYAATSEAALHIAQKDVTENPLHQAILESARLEIGHNNYKGAYARMLPLAQSGYSEAQFILGGMYDSGSGVDVNAAMATYWYRQAALHGHNDAQYNMGVAYANGDGVIQSTIEAVRWWRKAAAAGSLNSQFNLGVLYLNGEGIRRDPVEAVHWWHKAAEQGDPIAQYNLGALYASGEGVEKNVKQALVWWSRSAAQGFERAIATLLKYTKITTSVNPH